MDRQNYSTAVVDAPSAPESSKTTYKARACDECGTMFTPARPLQGFCTVAHKRAFETRAATQGAAILTLAKAWRASRGGGGQKGDPVGAEAFSELVSIIDVLNDEDRQAGRPSPKIRARRLLAQGRWIDRRKRPTRPAATAGA